MTDPVELLGRAIPLGVAGSAFIDVWSPVLRRRFHVAKLAAASPTRASPPLHRSEASGPSAGWRTMPVGVALAGVLLALWGHEWADSPSIVPPLAVGIGSVLAPWLVMQPASGAGIAGAKTARPWAGRIRNLGTHTVYGLGLYVSAVAISLV